MQAEATSARTISASTNSGLLECAERNWVRSAKFALNYDNATYIFLLALHASIERAQLSCDTKEAIEERKHVRDLIGQARKLLQDIE
jgi:hypothetical protein